MIGWEFKVKLNGLKKVEGMIGKDLKWWEGKLWEESKESKKEDWEERLGVKIGWEKKGEGWKKIDEMVRVGILGKRD